MPTPHAISVPRARHLALFASLLLLAACASIPISTMWRMRNFGPAEIAAIDPDGLRVATRMQPAHLRIDPAKARLLLTLTRRAGGADEVYTMRLREAAVVPDDLIPRGDTGWQALRLTEESAAMLREAMPRFTRDMKADYDSATFGVTFGFIDAAALVGEVELFATVRMVLAGDQSAFTLLERARIPITTSGTAPD